MLIEFTYNRRKESLHSPCKEDEVMDKILVIELVNENTPM